MTRIDAFFRNISALVPLSDGPGERGVRGRELGRAEVLPDAAVAVKGGKIVETGRESGLRRRFEGGVEVDLQGAVVVPGFVDGHTHPVFGATREEEFGLRCRGADYVEIARKGGGILSSVRSLRETGEAELAALVRSRLERFLELGTTTLEAKSGYGLSTDSELKSLRALRKAAEDLPLTLSPTFLGAHEVAPEYREDPGAYVELLVEEMIPEARPLADSFDAFLEAHVFDLAEGRRLLLAAQRCGFRLRVHVDEIEPLGGSELAAELGAASADHLVRVSEGGIRALAASETTAVLLPGTSFFLKKPYAPARKLIEAGALVALATDFNPGSCYTQSLPMVATLARLHLGMSPEECLNAMTRNAAASLGLLGERGTLHPGKAADFVALSIPSFQAFGYGFGDNPVSMTVKEGRPVALQGHGLPPGLAQAFSE